MSLACLCNCDRLEPKTCVLSSQVISQLQLYFRLHLGHCFVAVLCIEDCAYIILVYKHEIEEHIPSFPFHGTTQSLLTVTHLWNKECSLSETYQSRHLRILCTKPSHVSLLALSNSWLLLKFIVVTYVPVQFSKYIINQIKANTWH